MSIKKLCVIYRACGSECDGNIKPERPKWFNKLKCWKSFWDEFGNSPDVDIIVIWDGEENSLSQYINSFPINFIKIKERNNQKSLIYCYETFDKIKNNYKSVYFCEDDYLYLPKSKEFLIEALEHCHLFTLYHHPDRIFSNDDYTIGHEYISAIKHGYIRTGESTTCTVAMSEPLFSKLKDHLINFAKSGSGAPEDRAFYRFLLQFNIRLWHPITSFSTHVVGAFLGLFINWEKVNEDIIL